MARVSRWRQWALVGCMGLFSADGLNVKGIDFSKTQLWRLTKAGKFPRPISIGFKRRAWVEAEIDAWIIDRIGERDRSVST